jgi:ferredoxin
MTHIVTARCLDCRYTDCCVVCPAEAFRKLDDPAMLVIDPDACIDCMLCVPECPINAIYPESELPECYADWQEKNEQLFEGGSTLSQKKDPMPGAQTLEQIQAKEKADGHTVDEPSKAN